MIKLKFKIIMYKYDSKGFIVKKRKYKNLYAEDLKLNDVLDEILIKFNEDTELQHHSAVIIDIQDILWGKYFKINSEQAFADERIREDYYEYKLIDLCKQFKFDSKRIEVSINPPIGGYVGANRGIHYFFHTNEKDIHHIPHIHVKYGNVEFRVNLITLEILDKKTFKNPKKTAIALKMIELNQKELINYWNKVVVNGESIKFKMYLPDR